MGHIEVRIAMFTLAAMMMVLLTFTLTVINASHVKELNPFIAVGAFYSLLFSESIVFVSGLLAAKIKRGNPNVRVILTGYVMALMTGDATNDIIQMIFPGQSYLAAVAPVMIPALVMTLVAVDIDESQRHKNATA
jgi:hypothetical protein